MAVYHVNPATGEVGSCRAKKQCPFSLKQDHYGSAEAARQHYEKIMEGKEPKPLFWLLSPKNKALTGPEDAKALAIELHEKYKAHMASLTEEQKDALYSYAMYGAERINPMLRNMPIDHNPFLDPAETIERTKKQIEALDEAFAAHEETPKVVYRYMQAPNNMTVAEAVEALESKGTLEEPGFMSTSASIDWPLFQTLENPDDRLFILEIATTKGIVLQDKPYHQPGRIQTMENEVLLPRNMTFTVAGVEKRKKLSFGHMKESILRHAQGGSRKDRRKIEDKDFHSMPVVKLVQTSS